MSIELSKVQWQGLGKALEAVGYTPDSFVRKFEEDDDNSKGSVTLVERESSHEFSIASSGTHFRLIYDVPGTTRKRTTTNIAWADVEARLHIWAGQLKKENEATDPWGPEAEEMAHDDSLFTLDEIPMVEEAIEKSLNELKVKAIEHGVAQDRVETELAEIKTILKKSARNSTKREWLTLFKGIIVEKLVDWGMKTVLFQTILHTLINSAQEIRQLAEHATKHLL